MKEIVMVCGRRVNGEIERVIVLDQCEVDHLKQDLANDPSITEVWEVEGETVGYMNIYTGEITPS